jgi:hypothetical protein
MLRADMDALPVKEATANRPDQRPRFHTIPCATYSRMRQQGERSTVDFKRVLVTDRLAWEIFGAAAQERSLFVPPGGEEAPRTRRGPTRQRALSLLVLFDQVVIYDLNDVFRLPDLEKEGIVEIIGAGKEPDDGRRLKSKWKKGRCGSRGRPPAGLLRSLYMIENSRPLVVNRLLTHKDEFSTFVAHALGVSRRHYLNCFLDYVLAYARGDEKALTQHLFCKAFPEDLLRDISEELFDFSSRGDEVGPTNVLLIGAILFAEEIGIIETLSTRLGLGVATEHYGTRFRSERALKDRELDAIAAANRFLIVKAAFADERGCMPYISGIKHALALRKDPYLRALREQLRAFHSGLTTGDRQAVLEARRDIQKAQKRLARREAWDRVLQWVAYLAVPVGIAEILAGSIPIGGTAVSLIAATGTATSLGVKRKNEWVLFGT